MGIDPMGKNGKTWRAVLRGITDEQIEKGLIVFSDSGAKFIPKATEFKHMCRYGDDNREQAAHKAQARLNKGLPKLPASEDFARDQLKKAREILNKGDNDE